MASTAHKTDEEKKEYFDKPEDLDKKCDYLAELIKKSKHFVAFTGAGISTSAGIPDFRSGVNTVLPTGPGAWEKAATGKSGKFTLRKPIEAALPSLTHMALVKLEQEGMLKWLISQNVDGLHRKSGFPADKLAELHGNTNLEICKNKNCMKQYLRDFGVRNAQRVKDHETGRKCESCGGMLYDSIINFNENLPEYELHHSLVHSTKADLCLVLGSSLRVRPAAEMPEITVEYGGKLVIVNLQATPLDSKAFRINGMIDDVMFRVMSKLGLEIPGFVLRKRFKIMKTDINPKDPKKKIKPSLLIRGVDETGSPYTLCKKIAVSLSEGKDVYNLSEDPALIMPKNDLKQGKFRVELEFQGHYGEPNVDFQLDLEKFEMNVPKFYLLEFDPIAQEYIRLKDITGSI